MSQRRRIEGLREANGGVGVEHLLALDPASDPFWCGSDSDRRDAEWFANVWHTYSRPGMHLRGVHYLALSHSISKPDGDPYADPPGLSGDARSDRINRDWRWLQDSAKKARYLGLVDPAEIHDARSKPVNWLPGPGYRDDPAISVDDVRARLPEIDTALPTRISVPGAEVTGYGYDLTDQPAALSVWIEKSTMEDVLAPLCDELGVTLVTGTGWTSVTRVCEFLTRAIEDGRPVRIFYISDFDRSGLGMPVQASRQLEFWLAEQGADLSIALNPIALTGDQVAEWDLPTAEGKDGSEIVELDAIEALRPGALAQLVREAVAEWRDHELADRLAEAENEAAEVAADAWDSARTSAEEKRAQILAGVEATVAPYRIELAALAQMLDGDMQPHREALAALAAEVREAANALDVDLPERPTGEDILDGDVGDWLFSSERSYTEQLREYHEHQGHEIPRHVCGWCGDTFIGRKRKYCGDACRKAAAAARRVA